MFKDFMKKQLLITFLILVFSFASANAHDLFLKLEDFFLLPKSKATVRVLNGSFKISEGAVKLERLRDISLVTPNNELEHPQLPSWRQDASTTTSLFDLETTQEGNYVIGISTKFKDIELKADKFNEYLVHDGIPDTLEERKKSGELNKDVKEKYSKHVKAIFQVGSKQTDNFKKSLNYPVEIIPQQNPYLLKAGQEIEVLCLQEEKPIANQFILAGCENLNKEISARTNSSGIATIPLSTNGKWYIKFIYMSPSQEPGFNYESKWATLTFAIK